MRWTGGQDDRPGHPCGAGCVARMEFQNAIGIGGRPRRPDPAREASATVAPFRAWRGLQRVATGKPAQAAMELVVLMMGVRRPSFKRRYLLEVIVVRPSPGAAPSPHFLVRALDSFAVSPRQTCRTRTDIHIAGSNPRPSLHLPKDKGPFWAPYLLAIGGESGIRTRDTTLAVYTLSRRAP